MLKILCGTVDDKEYDWVRGRIRDGRYKKVRKDLLDEQIVKDLLLRVDGMGSVESPLPCEEGYILTKSLSETCFQFLATLENPGIVCDGYYLWSGAVPCFYRWCVEHDTDITLLISEPGDWFSSDITGLFLNTGKEFSSGEELTEMVLRNRRVLLGSKKGNTVEAIGYVENEDGMLEKKGELFYIDLEKGGVVGV